MSDVFSDKELLASAREYAFTGLLNITAISDEKKDLKRTLRDHFSAILAAIDGERMAAIDKET